LTVEELIAKLDAIRVDHPGAKVRPGRGNRLEI
jgi:hypothetical protein